MTEVNIVAEANELVNEWNEQKEQLNRDFLFVSGKIAGLQELFERVSRKANEPQDDSNGEDTAPSTTESASKSKRTRKSTKATK